MSEYKNVSIDGVEQWLYLIKRFSMTPNEALNTMEEHKQDVDSVLEYIKEMLNFYTLRPKDRKKLGKVKNLLEKEGYDAPRNS